MTWLAWRQFRANAVLAVAALAAIVAVLLLTRHHVAQAADPDQLTRGYQSLQLLGTVLIGVPAAIGAFWGAPMLARELETGTHRLAWTQSVTRRRWLATKLALGAVAAALVTGAFSLAFTWWSLPLDRFGNRIGTANFGQRGVVPIAYAVFALVLGTLLGALLRRTLPAMAATLAGFFVVRYAFQLFVRGHLVAPITASLPSNLFGQREGLSASGGGWIVSTGTLDATGRRLAPGQIDRALVDGCGLTRDSTKGAWMRCADQLGIHDVVRIHPASQFWPLQAWEASVFLALAALTAALCFWWMRHRST